MRFVDADSPLAVEVRDRIRRQVPSRQELHRMCDLIAGLPPTCRQAFTLRKDEGLSHRDIALRMAIAEDAVEKHIARALRHLMSAMKAD